MCSLKNQKGSITIFALVSSLFFVASVACVAMYMQSKQVAVDREYRQVKENYEVSIEKIKKEGKILDANTTLLTEDNVVITIPAGFTISKESPNVASEGIIITDSVDENGNEFVWVPINEDLTVVGTNKQMAKESTETGFSGKDANSRTNYEGALYNFNGEEGEITSTELKDYGQGTTSYREPDIISDDDSDTNNLDIIKNILTNEKEKYEDEKTFKDTMQEDYNEMIESVKTNGGFYVSRYEMGVEEKKITSKKIEPTTASNELTQSWYGLYARAKTYTNIKKSVQSSMIWGSQYDAMLNYALMGSDKGKVIETGNGYNTENASGPTTSGITETDKIMNIYDLNGNLYEWTLEEASNDSRTLRGSSYASELSPSNRSNYNESDIYDNIGTHFTLYITNNGITTISDIKKYGILDKTTTIKDSDEMKITIPAGFTITKDSGKKVSEGIVITDSLDAKGNSNGNEFVWIPCTVDEYNKEKEGSWPSITEYNGGTWGDSQPHEIGIPSIKKYEGFYVGRYEAGVPKAAPFYASEDEDSYYSSVAEIDGITKNTDQYIPVSKKGVQAWNAIDYTNAKKVSEKMINKKDVKSYLIDSHAWDTICRVISKYDSSKSITNSSNIGNYIDNTSTKFEDINTLYAIHDSSTWPKPTSYKKGLVEGAPKGQGTNRLELSTGASEDFKTFNIYDLGGNMFERTTENGVEGSETTTIKEEDIENATHHIIRGGGFNDYGSSGPIVWGRTADNIDVNPHVTVGFRVVLYLK